MKQIQLTLSLEEANLILQALGEMPFKQVFTLINKIQGEASQQLEGGQASPAPKEE